MTTHEEEANIEIVVNQEEANQQHTNQESNLQPEPPRLEPEDSKDGSVVSEDLASQENGDGTTCLICMEEWSIGTAHRVTCLKCGHIFGRSCIERWIKEKGSNAKCPICNKTARKIDLRDLWCKSVKAHDQTELMNMQQALENERRLRKTDSATIFQQNYKIELLQTDIDKMKKAITERDIKIRRMQTVLDRYNQMRSERIASTNNLNDVSMKQMDDLNTTLQNISAEQEVIDIDVQPVEMKGLFHLSEKIEANLNAGCRAIELCATACIILVTQPAPLGSRSIFGGFGLRKYSTIDTSVREFIPLHSKKITSMQFKPMGDLILTSGMDRRVRLTSIHNNTCIQSYHCDYDPVCVAWSSHRDQQFYVASGNCYLSLYDIRNTSEYIYQTNEKIANTRLLSITSTTSSSSQESPSLDGVLVNDAKGCQFLEVSDSSSYESEQIDRSITHLTNNQLPFEGVMGSVDYDKHTDTALITTRRSIASQNNCHNLVKLRKVHNDLDGSHKIECQGVRTYMGGRSGDLLSQSRILKHPTVAGGILVGACDDEAHGIKLWDSTDNTEYQTIRTADFIRDMVLYNPDNTNNHILYALSAKGIHIYRWDYA